MCYNQLEDHRKGTREAKFSMEYKEYPILEELDAAGVGYVLIKHEALATMELCRGVGAEYGAQHCKNLFLASRNGKRFCLLLMDADKPFRTGEVSGKLGLPRMGFGTEEQLEAVLGLKQGSVSALGLLNRQAENAYRGGALKLAVDARVRSRKKICVHPNENTATLVMDTDELFGFLASRGFVFEIVTV